jgi:hypothetical protein
MDTTNEANGIRQRQELIFMALGLHYSLHAA